MSSPRNPFPKAARDALRGGARVHGESSLNTFADVSSLTYCHADADGFAAYLNQFNPGNFRYKDAGVQQWQYVEPYDHWQDTYGVDAVKVFWHTGHGGMDGNGTFFAPLGAKWNGQTWVNSTQMTLANQTLRYVFWSTCLSLRVHDGHSPWRSWAARARGLRMIFGWETVSWDNPNYGKNFWRHWNSTRKLSSAWLQAGWDAGRDQAPSVAAMGASADEAKNRVFNEGQLFWEAVSSAWMWWVYWDAARSIDTPVETSLQAPPAEAYLLELGPLGGRRKALASVGDVTVVDDGLAQIQLATPAAAGETTASPLTQGSIVDAANGVVSALDLPDVDLVASTTRVLRTAGASADERADDAVAGYAVEYRQVVDGVPVITPEGGYLRVQLDAGGNPTAATLTARPVRERLARPVRTIPSPDGEPLGTSALDDQLGAHLAPLTADAVSAAPIPGTREVGYVIDGSQAYLGASQGSLVDFGQGLFKKVRVTVPLNQ